MLLQITINNFALIDKLTISFFEGFNVLSGETGAGKSILIDAINFVMGNKFNKDLIRTGEDKTYVEAIFTLESNKTINILDDLNIDKDNVVILSRETFQNGKSISKINGKAAVLSTLREISKTLLDIHGQHENQNLLEVNNHINYLDSFSEKNLSKNLNEYKNIYDEYISVKSKIEELKGSKDEQNVVNFLKYQIDDIQSADLSVKEEAELQEEFKILSHAEKISLGLNNVYSLLNEYGEGQSAYDLVSHALSEISSISKHMTKVEEISKNLESLSFSLEEIINDIRSLKDNIIYDEERLEKINNRIYIISNYKQKYGRSVNEILQYKDELIKQYQDLINGEEVIKNLQKKEAELINTLNNIALSIHEIRAKNALKLEKSVMEEFKHIGLEKSTFKVNVQFGDKIYNNGKDKVQFFISTNPGEPLKSLEKVVSGGELSRIMLALKTVFVNNDEIPSIIFDEVDTGISGRVAQSVAEKMYLISTRHQVLCVTHLPQIAAMADNNFLVSKYSIKDKTFTEISNLKSSEKEKEIARMIGGVEITEVTLQNAKEIIKLANLKKQQLNIHN
ncbi:DNA repair protein RecN [Clostridium polynesiense]|uniref:DNA repair protein RecN n=1 Tax=Clostridium polynesiense TaxID=1325933 RepID=UPI00058FD265|nr:DNA repair protein RecN [Clostridium polynesiense]